jgi:hypothetical protein
MLHVASSDVYRKWQYFICVYKNHNPVDTCDFLGVP